MKSLGNPHAAASIGAFLLLLAVQLVRVPDLATLALEGYDDLFQLALGLKASQGAWPGLDFFTNYGPGVSALSAVSWQWSHPILVEVLTGVFLMTAGLFAYWKSGSTQGRPFHSICLLITLALLTPSWAKYYYVFWPGLFLLAVGDPAAPRPPGGALRHWLWLGILVGLGGWFRPEIGLALGAALAGAWLLRWRAGTDRRLPVGPALAAVAGALAPWVAYYATAWCVRGQPGGPADLIDFFLVSTRAKAVDFRALPANPTIVGYFSTDSLITYLGILVVVVSLASIALCFPRGARSPGHTPIGRRAWCAACLLLCLSPQALHRIDLIHILQVVAPGLVAITLALAAGCDEAVTRRPRLRPLLQVGALAALALLVAVAGRIHRNTAPPVMTAITRLQGLAAGLDALDPAAPDLQLAAAAKSRTRDNDALLVPSIDTRLFVLIGRPFAGLFPHWSFRLPERWQERQIAALRANPAALVIHADYFRAADAAPYLRKLDFKGRNPLIDAYIDATYPLSVYQTAQWRILAPGTPR
ncbi:MAG: hypothetical protein U1F61_26805 [Opitutaceae bacterium]